MSGDRARSICMLSSTATQHRPACLQPQSNASQYSPLRLLCDPAGRHRDHSFLCLSGGRQLLKPSLLGWMGPDRLRRSRKSSIDSHLAMDSAQRAPPGYSATVLVGGPSLVSCHAGVSAGQHLRNSTPPPRLAGLEYARLRRLAWLTLADRRWLDGILPLLPLAMGELHVGFSNLFCPSRVLCHPLMDRTIALLAPFRGRTRPV